MEKIYILSSFLNACILILFTDLFMNKRKDVTNVIFVFLLFMVGIHMVDYQSASINLYMLFMSFVLLCIYTIIKAKRIVAYHLFYTAFIFLIDVFIMVSTMLLNKKLIFNSANFDYVHNGYSHVVCSLLSVVLFFIIYLFFKTRKTSQFKDVLKPSVWLTFAITLALLFVLLLLIVLLAFNYEINVLLLIGLLVFALCILCFFYYYHHFIVEAAKKLIQNDLKIAIYEQNRHFYDDLKQLYSKHRALQHDLKHHINLIQEMIENGQKEKAKVYFQQIVEKVETSDKVFVEREVINYLINYKTAYDTDKQIKKVIQINTDLAFIEDVDLCILLGNLLDNAYEAQKNIEQPLIEIIIEKQDQDSFLHIRNTFDGKIRKKDKHLQSTKVNQEEHGFGLRSVEAVIDKYQGMIDYYYDDAFFNVFVYFHKQDKD